MRRKSTAASARRWRLLVVVAAAGVALVPLPPAWVERLYSTSAYPYIQKLVTSISNLAPFALFDLLIVTAIAVAVALVAVDIAARRHTPLRIVSRFLTRTTVL